MRLLQMLPGYLQPGVEMIARWSPGASWLLLIDFRAADAGGTRHEGNADCFN
jgi:hypothetical protein